MVPARQRDALRSRLRPSGQQTWSAGDAFLCRAGTEVAIPILVCFQRIPIAKTLIIFPFSWRTKNYSWGCHIECHFQLRASTKNDDLLRKSASKHVPQNFSGSVCATVTTKKAEANGAGFDPHTPGERDDGAIVCPRSEWFCIYSN